MARDLRVFFLAIAITTSVAQGQGGQIGGEEGAADQGGVAGEGWELVLDADAASRETDDVTEAWRQVRLDDYEGALKSIEGSDRRSVHVIRAIAYNGLEKYDLAVAEARRALERMAENESMVPEAYNQLGLALLRPVLKQIHAPADPNGALTALAEAETSFRAAFALSTGEADGVLLNLAAALIAQRMLHEGWDRRDELDEVLRSVSSLLPEHSAWADESLAAEPTLPRDLAPKIAEQPPISEEADELRVYYVEGDVIPPTKLRARQPQYTEEARKARIQGVVIVRAIVDDRGIPTRLEVLQSLDPGLDREAMDAISGWRFEPATLKGRPVPVFFNLTVSFRLQ